MWIHFNSAVNIPVVGSHADGKIRHPGTFPAWLRSCAVVSESLRRNAEPARPECVLFIKC